MRSSAVRFLLDELDAGNATARERRPWGTMWEAAWGDLLIKVIRVDEGHRTSLQYHETKDEIIIPLEGKGVIEVGDRRYGPSPFRGELRHGTIRIKPGVRHRVTGPLLYLEVETNDRGRDTIRVEDDYNRLPDDNDQESLLPERGLE